jgi:hypothetical protein
VTPRAWRRGLPRVGRRSRTRRDTGGNAEAGRRSPAFPNRCCRGPEHAVRGAAPRTRPCGTHVRAPQTHRRKIFRSAPTPAPAPVSAPGPGGVRRARADRADEARRAVAVHARVRVVAVSLSGASWCPGGGALGAHVPRATARTRYERTRPARTRPGDARRRLRGRASRSQQCCLPGSWVARAR